MIHIKIATDFSDAPGGRFAHEGTASGEEFRVKILEPKYLEAKANNTFVEIDFDGGYGYLPSFLDEAFGQLAKKYSVDDVLGRLKFISNDEPNLIDRVKSYMMQSAEKETK